MIKGARGSAKPKKKRVNHNVLTRAKKERLEKDENIEIVGGKVIEVDRKAQIVSIPMKVRSIGQLSYFSCLLTSVNLENINITIIEQFAFLCCFQLEVIMFPSSLEEIGSCSFKNCGKLKYINFGSRSDLKKIGSYAFRGCFR